MRRSTQVLLVLMGGGMVSAAAIPLLRQPDCDPAVVQDGSCGTRSSSSSRSSTGSGFTRSTSSDSVADASSTSVARGGFGATGAARAGSSSGS